MRVAAGVGGGDNHGTKRKTLHGYIPPPRPLLTALRVLPLSKRQYEEVGLLVVVDERRLLHDHLALVAPSKRSKAAESATVAAASSSTRGSGWVPSGVPSPWECRAAQSRQARLAVGAELGHCQGSTLTMLLRCSCSTKAAEAAAGGPSRLRTLTRHAWLG